ncbi:hypothetical protein Despr_3013 [Desulfobulbus propionicus DSM 2032]|jgi:anti-anti-sigma regulatory factor|uniref:STAS domain-containing protein n=1 Tax=Desulfobulbus propionicus (strain ATCC 33891 / DSM 2032 / VKM B-1956 / 1pr3) TaxID=577650 RepID=A0A7U3YPF9_DESPD|nr:hypothetical protein [Desulfobulbus propionicus]ADW19146.1 hypothetical protein Despr_3013 [Desulfobulbus propionicus DSM 2032]
MHISNHIDRKRHHITIEVSGRIDAHAVHPLIQYAILETYGQSYREMVLDLRRAEFDHWASMSRLRSLLQVFKSVIVQQELRVTVLFCLDDPAPSKPLDGTSELEGVTIRYCNNHRAAGHFLVTDEMETVH